MTVTGPRSLPSSGCAILIRSGRSTSTYPSPVCPANRRLTMDVSSRHERASSCWRRARHAPASVIASNADRIGRRRHWPVVSNNSRGVPTCSILPVRRTGDTVAERQRLVLVVRHGEEGRAEPAMQTTDLVAQLLAELFIEPGQRLVEQQNRGSRRAHGQARRVDAARRKAGAPGAARALRAQRFRACSMCASRRVGASTPRTLRP